MKTKNLVSLPVVLTGLPVIASEAHASPLFLAQATSTNLQTGVAAGLGVLFLFGFIWGVINIWGGAQKLKHGDADGKMGIVSGIIIAGAAAIMTALFTIFGLGSGALTPQF